MSSNIVVPEVGESIVDARVAKWLRKEGEVVSVGDPLVELETDKIDLEVAAPQGGVLKRIDRKDGEDVKVGEVLGVIEDSVGATQQAAPPPSTPPRNTPADSKASSAEKTRSTPTARNAAQEHEVDLSRVRGSGDAGRVMRRDVEQAATGGNGAATTTPAAAPKAAAPAAEPAIAKARPASPVAEAPRPSPGDRTEERVRMSKRRATIAKRLVEAQSTAAMLTTFNEVDMSAVMALRERHKQAFKERHGTGLGIASFFVKASIGALRACPRINAEIQGDEMVV
jgi:2-oxoglutarate dehydrogenase E2 component (dihydrolipoamide succinyltransferase)